jgi:uncharacterized protein
LQQMNTTDENSAPATRPTDPVKPVRVLLVTGRGNTQPNSLYQDWIHTFYPSILSSILGSDASITISKGTADLHQQRLSNFDMVINNSLFLEPTKEQFDALLGFVENGGGFMALHAGLVSFLNDPRYVSMIGAKFVGHDPIGAFQVEARDNWYGWAAEGCEVHSIARGLTTFGVLDELYIQQMLTDDLTVVARAKYSPVMWVRTHGQGRVVGLALGHDNTAMANDGFQHLFRRGVIWSAGQTLNGASPDTLL